MATQGLALVGSMVGTYFGGPIGGAIGAAAGGYAGAELDRALGLTPPIKRFGPELQEIQIQTSAEGSYIAQGFGKVRMAGQVIWMSRYKRIQKTTKSGGKGGGAPEQETTTTTYQASIAIAVGEGPIVDIVRFWADSRSVNLEGVSYTVYKGTEDQEPDPLITSIEGEDFTPAFKGTAYIVFEDLPLGDYGNRIPNFNFEVFAFTSSSEAELEYKIKGVNIIPASGEYAYSPEIITLLFTSDFIKTFDFISRGWADIVTTQTATQLKIDVERFALESPNASTGLGESDWTVSMDDLQTQIPNIDVGQIVVSWFGSDLRIGECRVAPLREFGDRHDLAKVNSWDVSGYWQDSLYTSRIDDNGTATINGNPVYGGTPSDSSIYSAIKDLKERGMQASFYPFLLMDLDFNLPTAPANLGDTLPNPYSDNAATIGQPRFPWRGRITVSPAREYAGSPDGTASAVTQVNNFFGTATPSDFGSFDGWTIPFAKPLEESYSRMILHYAKLCQQAGGVDIFYIGSELVRILQTRGPSNSFPAVDHLVTLAGHVRTILGSGTKIAYAADWSEWNGYSPDDGSNDFFHHLDPLYASDDIDFIAIDNYMKLSDWRDGISHLDAASYETIYDLNYLKSNIEGGEDYDWFYASESDRESQLRTLITDGLGKPWTFRRKDLHSWWANDHYNRIAGVEEASSTDWVPQSKPITFSELGCPTVDKGSNQPNVFVDPKSSESNLPYFSSGARDDVIQRKFLEAHYSYWDDVANNPISTEYSEPMLDVGLIAIWTWDARPFPYFPALSSKWSDSENWQLGHWITGRVGVITLKDLVIKIMEKIPEIVFDAEELEGIVFGYEIDRVMTVFEMLQPLMVMYFFDMHESQGVLIFKHRRKDITKTITADEFVIQGSSAENYSRSRVEDTELPNELEIQFIDIGANSQIGSVYARRLTGESLQKITYQVAIATTSDIMSTVADIALTQAFVERETVEMALPLEHLALDPGDIIDLEFDTDTTSYRINEITYGDILEVSATRVDISIYERVSSSLDVPALMTPSSPMPLIIQLLDLPLLADIQAHAPFIAAFSEPWVSANFFRSTSAADFDLDISMNNRTSIGSSLDPIVAGPENEWDYGTTITVAMFDGSDNLLARPEEDVLNGANIGAILCANGEWEIFSWVDANLIATNVWELSKLLRGRFGTEPAMYAGAAVGAEFVVLNTMTQSNLPAALRDIEMNWKYGPANKSLTSSEYIDTTYTYEGLSLRPYSPVDAEAAIESNDDMTLTWKRRCRLPDVGDEWEVPLGEDTEAYEIDIYAGDGTTILRTLESTSETVTYTSADQVTDFGSNQTSIDVAIYQISVTFGRGAVRRVTLLTS